MGGKQRWTPDEEQALRDGVERYGPGKWRTIQKDPEFAARLAARSNVDLKDKWRNLTADPSQKAAAKNRAHGSKRGRSRQRGSAAARQSSEGASKRGASTPRRRGALEAAAAAAVLMGTGSGGGGGGGGAGPGRSRGNSRALVLGPKPEDMIIAAIISLGEPGGSHPDDMQDWIESQYNVAPGFGRVLAPTLQHMVETGRLDTAGGAGPGSRFRLATLKYAPQDSGGAAGSDGNASKPSSSDLRAFDQSAFEAAQKAAAAVAEAAEAAARADRLGDAAALFELAARQAEAESPTGGGSGWASHPQPKQEDEPG